MTASLVTTIVPVFNRPELLREAAGSVLAQTHRPIEIVIVDDGSTDATAAVADALAAQHDCITALHTSNRGPGLAREEGRRIARGEFIQHLDSDDLLLPRKFELQVAALRNDGEAGAAYGWTRYRHADGAVEETPWKRSGERIATMFPSMLESRWWDTPTPLYRASVIEAAGAWSDLRVEEDWEYDCRIAAQGTTLAFCPEWVCEVRARTAEHLPGRAALHDRARAHLLIAQHARTAKLDETLPEMQHFARELFHLARQCGAAGLRQEARQLVAAARAISPALDLRAYALAANVVGWRAAGAVAEAIDRRRSRRGKR